MESPNEAEGRENTGRSNYRAFSDRGDPFSNGLDPGVVGTSPVRSLGFDVVPIPQTAAAAKGRGNSNVSEGYVTATSDAEYVSPETRRSPAFKDSDVRPPSPAGTGETGSFHTPDALNSSAEEEDQPDFSVVIPQLEDQLRTDRPPHWEGEEGGGSGDSEGEVTVVVEDAYDHPRAEFVAEQPKLLLADPIEPRPEKEPLPPSLTNSALEASRPRQKTRSKGHPPSSETTPLISGSQPEEKTDDSCCCTLL